MVRFKPILKKPGELIRAEDWNKMQEDIKHDLEDIERKVKTLMDNITMLAQKTVIKGLESPIGVSFALDEEVPGETGDFGARVVGHLNRQWVAVEGRLGDICRFNILDYVDILFYWACADRGDKRCLEVILEYMDGTTHPERNLFIHDWKSLRPKGEDNPYVEYVLSPNERVWYKYSIRNPYPNKKVRSVLFRNLNRECSPKIGNAIEYVSRVRLLGGWARG